MMASSLKWLTHRLRTMGPAEMLSRLADSGQHLYLYASLGWEKHGVQRLSASVDRLNASELKGHLGMVAQEEQDCLIAEASLWLNHRGSFFDLYRIPLGEEINWHCDYSSGVVGPMRYSGFINHRDATRVGDVKYIWEINRLQHLVLLALAAVWTDNRTYVEEIERQTLSWRAQNPFMRGLNWKSPLEAGIRLISWAFVSFLIEGPNRAETFFHKALGDTIYQHQYFIRKFYSKHSSANNHLIGEMAGLYVASIFWPRYRESSKWRAFAKRKLIQEVVRQVDADGVGKERATEYQLFIFEFFLLSGALGHAHGDPFPQEYWERLRDMATFLAALSDREGNLPMFGDGDNGQVLWLPESVRERAGALIRLGQLLRRATTSEAGTNVRSLLLLWGQRPEELPLAPIPVSDENLRVFPQGGYYILANDRGGDNEMLIVFDAGPLGFPPLYAHGHADALSFWLSYGGHEFLVDPGTFYYYANDVWRAYFRGTAAHNTVRIDGKDQSVAGGRFLWRSAARCWVERVEDNDDFVAIEGFHDGYLRLADAVIHQRSMRLHKKSHTLVIIDRLECRKDHEIEVFFHFSEKCQIRQVGSNFFEVANGKKCLSVRLDAQLKPELYRGSENPIAGWVSHTFGTKEPAFTIIARASLTGPVQFLSEIAAVVSHKRD